MIEYRTLVGDRTLEDFQTLDMAEPFSETFWILNETEHGTEAPNRLYAFAELLAHPAHLLVPYLARYLWEVPYPAYTAAAWTHLSQIVEDTADLVDLAHEVLTTHPHGALRAEVLRWDEDYSTEYLEEDPRFTPLVLKLMQDDPAPAVRAAAVSWLFFVNHFSGNLGRDSDAVDLILSRLADDPAAEVRERLFQEIAQSSDSGLAAEKVRTALIAALKNPANSAVLPRMLRVFGQRQLGGLKRDPDMVALMLNLIAAGAETRQAADLRRTLGWLEPGMGAAPDDASALWLGGAPYADGAALVNRAKAIFADEGADPVARAQALSLLSRLGQAADPRALLSSDLTAAALDEAEGAWQAMDLMFASVGENGAAQLYPRLMAHVLTRPDFGGEGRVGHEYAKRLSERAMRFALRGASSQRLLDGVVAAVRDWPDDLSFALYDLGRRDTGLRLDGLKDIALDGQNLYARRYTAGYLALRVVEPGDAKAGALLEQVLATTREVELVGEAIGELPPRADLDPALADRLMAATAWVPAAEADPDDYLATSAKQRVVSWRDAAP